MQLPSPQRDAPCDTSVKLGAWLEQRRFASAGWKESDRLEAAQRPFGAYVVLDRTLWRSSDGSPERLDGFLRTAWVPRGGGAGGFDRYVDAGLGATGVLPRRPEDFLGLAVAYGRKRNPSTPPGSASELGIAGRGYELALDLSYAARLAPCCMIQPGVQYLRYAAPAEAPGACRSALVVGVRVSARMW